MPSWSLTDLRRSSPHSSHYPVYIDEVIIDHRIQQLNTKALSRQYKQLRLGCVKPSLSDSVLPSSEGSQTSSCSLVHDCCVGNPTLTRCVPNIPVEEISRRKKRKSRVMKSAIPSAGGYGFGEFRGTMSVLTDNKQKRSHAFQLFPHVGYEANRRLAHSRRRYLRAQRRNQSAVCATIRRESEVLNVIGILQMLHRPKRRSTAPDGLIIFVPDVPVNFQKPRRITRCPKL